MTISKHKPPGSLTHWIHVIRIVKSRIDYG